MSDDVGKVFIGGLPKGCTSETLEAWGGQFGAVTKVDVKLDPMGVPRGFGFVTFDSQEAADAAIANKDNNIIEGKWIDVKAIGVQPTAGGKGGGKGGLADASNPKMFIGALPKSATEDSVTNHFSQFGTLSEVLVKLAEDGTCKGFAFITFEDASSAKAVLDNYDNNMFEGKWIDCKSVVNMGKGGGKDMGKGKGMNMWGGGGKDMGKGKGGKDMGKGGKGGSFGGSFGGGGKGGYGGGYGGDKGGYGGGKAGSTGHGGGKSGGKSAPPALGYGSPSGYSPAPSYGGPPAYGGYGAAPGAYGGGYGAPKGYGPAPSGGKGYGSAPYW